MSNTVELHVPQESQTQGFKPLDEVVWHAWVQKNDLQDKQRAASSIKAVTWASIAVLIAAAVVSPYILAPYVYAYEVVVRSVIALGAIVIMFESLRVRQYAFTPLFAGIVLVFNPVFPRFVLSGNWPIVITSTLPFIASLVWMNEKAQRATVSTSASA
jgi:hypothetical protein